MASSLLAESENGRLGFSPWLFPAVSLGVAIVLLNAMASLGYPFRSILPWLLVPLIGTTMIGLNFRRFAHPGVGWTVGFVTAWFVVSVCAGSFFPLPYVTAHPDAWSYNTLADYLADYGRLREEGMPLVDQFASHLRDTRFSSPSILSLIETGLNLPGKLYAHGVFYFLMVFVSFSSTAALAESLGFDRHWRLITAAVACTMGWTANAIVIGNYDNLVFVALLPAALSLIHRIGNSPRIFDATLLALAAIGAAMLCTYPEGTALVLPASLPVVFLAVANSTKRHRAALRLACVGAFVTLLVSPYLPFLIGFLTRQVETAATEGARPGVGNFAGLLTVRFLPSVFALGTEYPSAANSWLSQSLALILLFLLGLGIFHLNRQHRWFAVSSGLALGLLLWQLLLQKYDYGVYKVLYCHGWLIVPAVVAGCRKGLEWVRPGVGLPLLIGLAAAAGFERWGQRHHRVWPNRSDPSMLSDLRELRHISSGVAILVDVRDANDQAWALSLLRGQPLIVTERLGYLAMPHVQPNLNRTAPVEFGKEFFVLKDTSAENVIWQSGRFTLSHAAGAIVSRVDNPNGLESLNGQPFVWIAHSRESTFHITAFRSGEFTLSAADWSPGPSLPTTGTRSVSVTDASGSHIELIDPSRQGLVVQLKEGANEVKLRILESPSVLVQENGDQRELMLGIKGYFLKPSSL